MNKKIKIYSHILYYNIYHISNNIATANMDKIDR